MNTWEILSILFDFWVVFRHCWLGVMDKFKLALWERIFKFTLQKIHSKIKVSITRSLDAKVNTFKIYFRTRLFFLINTLIPLTSLFYCLTSCFVKITLKKKSKIFPQIMMIKIIKELNNNKLLIIITIIIKHIIIMIVLNCNKCGKYKN